MCRRKKTIFTEYMLFFWISFQYTKKIKIYISDFFSVFYIHRDLLLDVNLQFNNGLLK